MSRGMLRCCMAAACSFAAIVSSVGAAVPINSADAGVMSRPKPGTAAYWLSWGVAASRADGAYRKGATGRGVVIAMIDTGVDESSAMMFRHLSPDSTDLVPTRAIATGDRNHGEQTASLLAGKFAGTGTFGIAYDATLLSIRADRDGSCLRVCAFDPQTLVRAIDYAVEHGAQIIGMPLASRRPLPQIETALQRAAEHGVIIVAAAGNDGAAEPVWPARYAADSRFANAMIVAGASDLRGRQAAWSNKAGAAKARYVSAPGERVVVDCAERTCSLVSGTSYSVSYAAGALALLLSRNPALTGKEAALALLESADGIGNDGSDDLTGRGRLDVSRALRIVDRLSAAAPLSTAAPVG
jgi:subtilisin family serine protease